MFPLGTGESKAAVWCYRFVSGELLGVKGGTGFLSVVSPDAVVYGSGESVVLLTRVSDSYHCLFPECYAL